jgi:hypothetical protein
MDVRYIEVVTVSALSKARNLLPRTMELWVRISFQAWIYVHFYLVFVSSCVDSGIAMLWSPIQGALPSATKINIFRIILNRKGPEGLTGQEEEEEEEGQGGGEHALN